MAERVRELPKQSNGNGRRKDRGPRSIRVLAVLYKLKAMMGRKQKMTAKGLNSPRSVSLPCREQDG
jgi:hypothetical protein